MSQYKTISVQRTRNIDFCYLSLLMLTWEMLNLSPFSTSKPYSWMYLILLVLLILHWKCHKIGPEVTLVTKHRRGVIGDPNIMATLGTIFVNEVQPKLISLGHWLRALLSDPPYYSVLELQWPSARCRRQPLYFAMLNCHTVITCPSLYLSDILE